MSKAQMSPLSFTAGEELEPFRFVKMSGDYTVQYADAGDEPVGATQIFTENTILVSIVTITPHQTIKLETDGAITQNDPVYVANDGKVSSSVNGQQRGIALEAATASGDVIEVLPFVEKSSATTIANDFRVFDDFLEGFNTVTTTGRYVSTIENSSTAALNDEANGVLKITTGTTDNNQHLVIGANETFLMAASKPMIFKTRIKITEAATDENMFFIGLSDTITADQLVDDTGAIRSSFDGFGFYKKTGQLKFHVVSSNAATQNTGSGLSGGLTTIDATSGTYYKLRVEVVHTNATTATLTFYIDGVLVDTQTILYSGLQEMHFFAVVKTGTAAAEIMDIDYWEVTGTR